MGAGRRGSAVLEGWAGGMSGWAEREDVWRTDSRNGRGGIERGAPARADEMGAGGNQRGRGRAKAKARAGRRRPCDPRLRGVDLSTPPQAVLAARGPIS